MLPDNKIKQYLRIKGRRTKNGREQDYGEHDYDAKETKFQNHPLCYISELLNPN